MKMKTAKMGGALLAASMAAAAAAYLYVGKDAPARRKKAAEWMKKAEAEVVSSAKSLKDVAFNKTNYQRIVKEVSKKYRAVKDIDPKDVTAFVAMVAKNWEKAGRAAKVKAKGVVKKNKA